MPAIEYVHLAETRAESDVLPFELAAALMPHSMLERRLRYAAYAGDEATAAALLHAGVNAGAAEGVPEDAPWREPSGVTPAYAAAFNWEHRERDYPSRTGRL